MSSTKCSVRHVVQAVGELDEQDADVTAERQHQFAEVLRLFGAIRLQLKPREFGYAIDQPRHIAAEAGFDLRQGDRGILDDVVQQAGDDAAGVEPVVGEDAGDGDGVVDVGLAIVATLRRVGAARHRVGVLDQRDIGIGIVAANLGREFGQGPLILRGKEDIGGHGGAVRGASKGRQAGRGCFGSAWSGRHACP